MAIRAPCRDAPSVHDQRHRQRQTDLLAIEDTKADVSRLATSPQVDPFFAIVGYGRTDYIDDGWGPGLDKVEMHLGFKPGMIAGLRQCRKDLAKRHGIQEMPND